MSSLPEKTCASCGRRFTWRKKWARAWNEVRFCSDRRRRTGVRAIDTTARRLTAQGVIEIVRGGVVVDPSLAKGPLRLRLRAR